MRTTNNMILLGRRPLSWLRFLFVALCAIHPSNSGFGDTVSATWPTPQLDRWMYPFNSTPGTRPVISTFGSDPGATLFDSRDGQFIVAYSTGDQIPPALGVDHYTVITARLTIEFANDLVAAYDPSPDSWRSFLAPTDAEFVADSDAGQSVDLFGCGFRNGFTAATFMENSPYATPPNPMASGVRNAFAMSFNDAGGALDVSNNPRERFEPRRFATGACPTVAAGALVPVNTQMHFDLHLTDPHVQGYLRAGLNDGKLFFVISSLTFVQQQGGNFPAFYAKENPLIPFQLAHAASLQLTVETGQPCAPVDTDCNGTVDGVDLATVLSNWGSSGQGDLNHDGVTDGLDLAALLGGWSP